MCARQTQDENELVLEWIENILEFIHTCATDQQDTVSPEQRRVIVVRSKIGGFDEPLTRPQIARLPRKEFHAKQRSINRRVRKLAAMFTRALASLDEGVERDRVVHDLGQELKASPRVGKMAEGVEALRETLLFCAKLGDEQWYDNGGAHGLFMIHVH